LKLTHLLNQRTFHWLSPELNSRNSAWTCSRRQSRQFRKSWKMQEWAKTKYTTLF
jgi:hypothetical protein